jgi:cyclomaltodextrinase
VSHGFDGAYDWTIKLGEWAWTDVWTSPDQLVERLHAALTNDGFSYGEDALIFRFLNNNDTGERFVAQYGVGVTKVAAALLFTVHGTPGPYTGDEIGAEYDPYEDIEPLDWDHDPHRLRPYYRRLALLRTELGALRSRSFARVEARPASRIYAYVRSGSAADEPVLVVLNFHEADLATELVLPGQFGAGTRFVDRLSGTNAGADGDEVRAEGRMLRLAMPPYTARILVPV